MRNGSSGRGRSCVLSVASVSLRRRADALHLVGSEFEVEDVVVFGDVGGVLASRW